MSNPGRINRRLVLEAPAETPDGAGGVLRAYAPVVTLWASLTPVSAHGDADGGHHGGAVTHRIGIRHRSDITTRHRLRDGARIFRIVSLRERDASARFLDISAQERID